MFDMTPRRNLILVCTDKTKAYANYFQLLISSKDDSEESVKGVQDGSVDTSVWTEEQFDANRVGLSSQEHIIFVGESSMIDAECRLMENKFDNLGMQYGWLGKRGYIRVSKKGLSHDEYQQFLSFAKPYQEFERVKFSLAEKPAEAEKVNVIRKIASVIPDFSAKKEIMDQQFRCLILVMYLKGLNDFLEG